MECNDRSAAHEADKCDVEPLTCEASFTFLQARMTRAPRPAKSSAASFPMPELAPVTITVFPVKRLVLLQIPTVSVQ